MLGRPYPFHSADGFFLVQGTGRVRFRHESCNGVVSVLTLAI